MKKVFSLIWKCDKGAFVKKLIYTALVSLLPLASLYIIKTIVDDVAVLIASGAGDAAVQKSLCLSVALFCGITLLCRLISTQIGINNEVLSQKLTDFINMRVQEQSVRLDMAYYDNPDYYDTLHRAQQEAAMRPIRMVESSMALFGSALSLMAVAIMILSASYQAMLVLMVAAVPTFVVRMVKARRIYGYRRDTTPAQRRCNYYGALLTGRQYAKEVRLFGLSGYLRRLYVEGRKGLVERLLRISRHIALWDVLAALIEAAALLAVMYFLLSSTLSATMTVGGFVMIFEAFRRGQGYMTGVVAGVSGIYEHKLFVQNLFDFLSLEPSIVSPIDAVSFPERVESIEFDDVTFTYPGMQKAAVEHFTFTASRGVIATLKGPNGSGKTTILKLLMRFYDPQQGTIRINGIDIRRFKIDDLRHNTGAVFQDFVHFYFTAEEVVAFGDVSHELDPRRLHEALRLSGADKVVSGLHDGLSTQLGRQFEGGEELSMGQWQRLAMARQYYKNAQVLVFDESAAWQDDEGRHILHQAIEELKESHVVIVVNHEG